MRKCIRCNIEMIEDLDVKVEGGAYGVKVTQQGIFKETQISKSLYLSAKTRFEFFCMLIKWICCLKSKSMFVIQTCIQER